MLEKVKKELHSFSSNLTDKTFWGEGKGRFRPATNDFRVKLIWILIKSYCLHLKGKRKAINIGIEKSLSMFCIPGDFLVKAVIIIFLLTNFCKNVHLSYLRF